MSNAAKSAVYSCSNFSFLQTFTTNINDR